MRNEDDDVEFFRFNDKMKIDHIGDLFELFKDKISLKLVTIVYDCFRHFDIKWPKYDELFEKIDSHDRDRRHIPSFYDILPDDELSAKSYSIHRCAAKAGNFDAFELVKFIDERFYKSIGIEQDPNNSLIHSVKSCRLDLRRWGARFESSP